MCASAMFSHELPLIFISLYCGDFFFSAQPIKLRLKPYKCEWKVKNKFNSFEFLLENFLFSQFPTSTQPASGVMSFPAFYLLQKPMEFNSNFYSASRNRILYFVSPSPRCRDREMVLKSFYAIP